MDHAIVVDFLTLEKYGLFLNLHECIVVDV